MGRGVQPVADFGTRDCLCGIDVRSTLLKAFVVIKVERPS